MQDSSAFLVVVLVTLVVFLIGREVVCWYWKINKSIALQESILIELKKVNHELQRRDLDKVG